MRILVVEDEKLLCDGIAEDLELEKYTVERCYDGAEAYDLLLSESFDLLILDLNLPGMDGLDLLRAVRAEQPELRVLIPVSYTHLDVYKRQIVTLLLGMDGSVVDVLTGTSVEAVYYGMVESSEKVVAEMCIRDSSWD